MNDNKYDFGYGFNDDEILNNSYTIGEKPKFDDGILDDIPVRDNSGGGNPYNVQSGMMSDIDSFIQKSMEREYAAVFEKLTTTYQNIHKTYMLLGIFAGFMIGALIGTAITIEYII